MKKVISFLLIIVMLFVGVVDSTVFTYATNTVTIGDYILNPDVNFTPEDDKEAQLWKYTGSDTVLDIPEYIGEYKITSVYGYIVSRSYNPSLHIEQINLPATVVDVDDAEHYPFHLCKDCSAINVDENNPVFSSENGILYSKDFSRLIRVPCGYPGTTFMVKDGVKTIGKSAMSDCRFTEIEFSNTILSIESDFMEHSQVEELYFPDSLQQISSLAFHNNSKTKFVYFGKNVKIDKGFTQYDQKFSSDTYGIIREFAVSGNNPYLSVQDGILFNKDYSELICFPRGKEFDTFVVPNNVKRLADNAFSGTVLTTLNTNNVEIIGRNTIDSNTIKHYILGEGLKSIGIGGAFFAYQTKTWTFLSRDCEISVYAYSGEKRTVYGYYDSSIHQYYITKQVWHDIIDFVLLDEAPEQGFKYTDLTNDTVRIDSYTGFDTALEVPAYIDGKKVVEIGAYAFRGNTSITTLTLPQTIERIGSHAFDDLTKVTTLTIPASVKKMDSYALSGMSALTKLYVNSFSCIIGENAFPDVRIFACSGSTAESYAGNNKLSFVSVGHQFVSEEIENEKLKKTCTLCGYTEVVNNPNAQHSYVPEVIAPTCTQEGYTVFTCSVCGDFYTGDYRAALGHEPFEIKATAPTCQVEGKTAGSQCARCHLILKEQEPIAVLPHEYDGGKITTAPTCITKGIKTFTCRNCDASYTEEVPLIAHHYEKSVKEPTCTEGGYTIFTCSYCHDTYRGEETAMSAHVPQVIPAVAATCTSEGSTEGSRCAVCELILKAPQKTDKLPHQYNAGVVTKKATCQAAGTMTYSCKNCEASYEKTIAKIDHIYGNVVKKAASFSQNGVVNNECSMCHALRKSTVIKALKSVTLTNAVFTYTGGKLAAPKVIVSDSAGKTVATSQYTLTYIARANGKAVSNISAIGQYKVQVKFKKAYSGVKELYFTVKPRAVVQYTPLTAKKAVSARWRKDTSATGYQVVIAANKAFTVGKKTITLNKNGIAAQKFTGLKSGKIYYIKIRAYKRITVDGKSVNIFSSYSPVKAVKCK